ncbi:MAG: hypothetical protein R3B47_06735 [Bacteroidia bacterium]
MKKNALISFLVLWSSLYLYSQDTLRIGPSYYYSADEVQKLSGKGFLGNYGQENIVFDQHHTQVDFCYYKDSVRICYGYHFRITDDSTLIIGSSLHDTLEAWTFRKLDNKLFYVYRYNDGLLESGKVHTLIPLQQIEPFSVTTPDQEVTLWKTNNFTFLNRRYGYYLADFNVTRVQGKIYDYDKVDTPPVLLNGDSLPSVEIDAVQPCLCDPIITINTVTCIVTREGKIVNIEQALGDISDHCAYTMMEINRKISAWGKVKPATKNGKAVNVRWFIKVDDLSEPNVHPALVDSDENRKAYLRRKRR